MPQLTDDTSYPPVAPMQADDRFVIITPEGIRKLLLSALSIASSQVTVAGLTELEGSTLADVLAFIDTNIAGVQDVVSSSITVGVGPATASVTSHELAADEVLLLPVVTSSVSFYDINLVAHSSDLTAVKVWNVWVAVAVDDLDAARIVGTPTSSVVAEDAAASAWGLTIDVGENGPAITPTGLPVDASIAATVDVARSVLVPVIP